MNKTKYMQTDSRWGGLGYPKKPYYIRNCGCGEVSIANIIIEMQKYANYTPATIQPYCKQFAAPNGDGTYWSGIPKMMKNYGLTEVKEHATMPSLWKELEKGNRVCILLMGSKPAGSKKIRWTSGGHLVCGVGFKYVGSEPWLYIKDSYSFSANRNGWLSYSANLKNDVLKVWSGKLNGTLYGETTPTTQPADGKLVVDGIGGLATVQRLQEFLGVSKTDGITIRKDLQKYVPALKAYDYGSGSPTVLAMQKWLGISQDGLWGSGTSKALQKKVGVSPQDGIFGTNSMKKLQEYLNTHDKADYPQTSWVDKANAWAKKIANEKYHYVLWKPKVTATHTCPICTGRKYDNYFGWNCIGAGFAYWHHGANIKCKCNCGVIDNAFGEKLLKLSDAEAQKQTKAKVGINDIKVIRNGGKNIPKSQWKAGDICLMFSGNTYKHTFVYMGGESIWDSTRTSKVADNIKVRNYKNYTCKIIIRYTGK